MKIEFSAKTKKYLINKHVSSLLLGVKLIEEPCTQIYNPTVKIINDQPEENQKFLGKYNNVNLYIEPEFIERFGNPNEVRLDLKGLLKKHIEIMNVDPIITNICKI